MVNASRRQKVHQASRSATITRRASSARMHTHAAHHGRAVVFHGALADGQIAGDVLAGVARPAPWSSLSCWRRVRPATSAAVHHAPQPRADPLPVPEARSMLAISGAAAVRPSKSHAPDARLNGKVIAPAAGDQDQRRGMPCARRVLSRSTPADPGQMHIGQHTAILGLDRPAGTLPRWRRWQR
jgi:hypothetical protein